MHGLSITTVFCIALATAIGGGVFGGYGPFYGPGYGLGYGLGYGGGYGEGYGGGYAFGGVGIGSSVALLRGGPGFYKLVAGPAFLVRTAHQVNQVGSGGAILAHSGLGGGYGGGYGYGGYGYGGGYGLGYKG